MRVRVKCCAVGTKIDAVSIHVRIDIIKQAAEALARLHIDGKLFHTGIVFGFCWVHDVFIRGIGCAQSICAFNLRGILHGRIGDQAAQHGRNVFHSCRKTANYLVVSVELFADNLEHAKRIDIVLILGQYHIATLRVGEGADPAVFLSSDTKLIDIHSHQLQ